MGNRNGTIDLFSGLDAAAAVSSSQQKLCLCWKRERFESWRLASCSAGTARCVLEGPVPMGVSSEGAGDSARLGMLWMAREGAGGGRKAGLTGMLWVRV